MMSRPIELLQRRGTSYTTLAPDSLEYYGREDISDPLELGEEDISVTVLPVNREAEAGPTLCANFSWYDTFCLTLMFIMLVWPWILLGELWRMKGLQFGKFLTKMVLNHPHGVAFFVTLLGNIVSMIVSFLFSFATIRFAQEWVTVKEDVTVFHISVISGFSHHKWPWSVKDLMFLFNRTRWLPIVIVGACVGAFTLVPSSTTSLITPVLFNRNASLQGTELDFSSTAADCLKWFNDNPIPNNCDWKAFNNMEYTECLGENQMVDVLESGRGNILSLLSNNSQSLTLSQLGAKDGMHFLGPIRGVLPMGPNGVPAFDTLQHFPFNTSSEMIPYNYTVHHQGLASNISCHYDTQTPITYVPIFNDTLMFSAGGNCSDGLTDYLAGSGVQAFPTLNTNNTLTFWSCKSVPTGGEQPTYYVYLRGHAFYRTEIGNITCTVSPIQPAIFPVVYQSHSGIFSTEAPTKIFTNILPGLIERMLVALGGDVWEAQNIQANQIAESVITFGVKAFGLPYDKPNAQYLRLYEAMLQGIVEYEATYARLVYSTFPNPPDSCKRTVNGSVSYQVVGWYAKPDNIFFLIPMTLFNLTSFVVLLGVMLRGKNSADKFDPSAPEALLTASVAGENGESLEWGSQVKYHPEMIIQRDPWGSLFRALFCVTG